MGRIIISLILLSFLALSPNFLYAQASVNVSTLDPVYRDIDKLVAHGLVKKIIVGQRPFSRREIARITGAAMKNLPQLKQQLTNENLSEKQKEKIRQRLAYLRPILRRMEKRFHEELIQLGYLDGDTNWLSVHLPEHVAVDILVADSPPRPVPNNGLGGIDAVINPLLQYRQGRRLVDGANVSLEVVSWLRASNHFALLLHPRLQLGLGRGAQPDVNDAFIQSLYGKIFFKNFEIEIGRDSLFYGQGHNAGLLLSNNPRGLDMIKISNDIPFFLPWFLKYMGANKMSFFYADLGPEQSFPHAYLLGYKWSLQPLSWFELGFSFLTESGGEGSPPASFGTRVKDAIPIGHLFAGTQDQIGNKIGGVDFRFRIPPARGMELYGEVMFDDVHAIDHLQFVNDAGYIGGIYLPRVDNMGKVDLRFEYHRTGTRYYQHAQFVTGLTLNQFILGDNLGPNAQGIYAFANWDVDRQNKLSFDGAFEKRSADVFQAVEIDGHIQSFQKIQNKPKEKRYRMVVGWLHRMKNVPLLLQTRFGYERVNNFNFVSGNSKNNFLGEMSFVFHFDGRTHFLR